MTLHPGAQHQLGQLAAGGPHPKELFEQARQRDLQEQARQKERAASRPDYSPRPRELTMKDVADYERAETQKGLRDMAREIQRENRLIDKIERVMQTNYDGYMASNLPRIYSKLTGADKDAAERK